MRKITTSVCENCNRVFELRLSDKNRGRGRFCGKSCAATGKNNSAFIHGHARKGAITPEYSIWAGMIKRTSNPSCTNYSYYGGRGIKVCARWQTFPNFLADMGLKPSPQHSIERINNDGDYEPSNCKWATKLEQRLNQRPRGTC